MLRFFLPVQQLPAKFFINSGHFVPWQHLQNNGGCRPRHQLFFPQSRTGFPAWDKGLAFSGIKG
jgi:hypothetical protein